MNKKLKLALFAAVIIGVIAAAVMFFKTVDVAVLNPKGQIADQQRNLIIFTIVLSFVVVVPVFTLLGVFAWKYREGNTNADYRPNWDGDKKLEAVWWGIPCVIILVLSVITWQTSHSLDPYKSIDSNVKPLNVQVVALQWKWLFIYPDQKVASMNSLSIPEKTPVNFTITSDAPMNAFWIPSLGSQVYAMSGMSTQLHLEADRVGTYKGSSSNISGEHFADMTFMAHSLTSDDFNKWVVSAQGLGEKLDKPRYDQLAKPSVMQTPSVYSLADTGLYNAIIMKYMMPTHDEMQTDDAPLYKHNPSHVEDSDTMHMSGMEGM